MDTVELPGSAGLGTAPFYGSGRAEEIVGRALRGLAERPVLLTKCVYTPLGSPRFGGDLRSPSAGVEARLLRKAALVAVLA